MRRDVAEALADELLATYRLDQDGWTFAWSRAKTVFGLCDYRTRTISLSGPLTDVNDPTQVEDTLRHEIAHAIAGSGAGHGPDWRQACREVGAVPRRCTDQAVGLERPWRLVCSACRTDLGARRHRVQPRRRKWLLCRPCADQGDRHLGVWINVETGEERDQRGHRLIGA